MFGGELREGLFCDGQHAPRTAGVVVDTVGGVEDLIGDRQEDEIGH